MHQFKKHSKGLFAKKNELTEGLPDLNHHRNLVFFWIIFSFTLLLFPMVVDNYVRESYLIGTIGLLILLIFFLTLLYMYFYGARNIQKDIIYTLALGVLVIVISKIGVAGAQWAYSVIVLFSFVFPALLGLIRNIIFVSLISTVTLNSIPMLEASRVIINLICVMMFCFIFARIIEKLYMTLLKLIDKDVLTGAYNRFHMEKEIDKAISLFMRYKTKSAVIIIDIDFFKKLNDRRGHLEGDKALRGLVELIKQRLRDTDMIFRFGGEEFVILLPGVDLDKGISLANELRAIVENEEIISNWKMTISAGVTDIQEDDTKEQLLKRVDEVLYKAKQSGRNKVLVTN